MPGSTDRRRARRGAWASALAFTAVQAATGALLLWGCALLWERLWLRALLLFLTAGDLLSVPFVWIALRQRLKEIKGGEKDAAAEY